MCGVLALLGGGLTQFYPEYAKLGGFLAFIGSGLGLLFARDNNVTSEQAGVDPASKAVKQFSNGPTPPTLPLWLLCGFLGFGLMFGLSGCAWFHPQDLKPVPVAAGQDSVVVNAERIQQTSLFAYQELIEWELANRAFLAADVSRAVDRVRREFPTQWKLSRKILADYKTTRGTDLSDLNRVNSALSAAQTAMLNFKGDNSDVGALFNALTSLNQSINTLKAP